MTRYTDLTGNKYGRLTVLSVHSHGQNINGKKTRIKWLCRCDCGKDSIVSGLSLTTGNTRSCGCLMRDTVSAMWYKHGMSHSPEHNTWTRIINRCTNKRCRDYKWYGLRGIKVCDEWLRSFDEFFRYIGKRPTNGHSIERLDVNKGYEPGNVIWLEMNLQHQNQRNNVVIDWNGEKHCMAEWARITGISYYVLRARRRSGMTAPELFQKDDLRHTNSGDWGHT